MRLDYKEVRWRSSVSLARMDIGPGRNGKRHLLMVLSLRRSTGKLQEERRRSLSKESGATIMAELANVMQELKNVHTLLDLFKV